MKISLAIPAAAAIFFALASESQPAVTPVTDRCGKPKAAFESPRIACRRGSLARQGSDLLGRLLASEGQKGATPCPQRNEERRAESRPASSPFQPISSTTSRRPCRNPSATPPCPPSCSAGSWKITEARASGALPLPASVNWPINPCNGSTTRWTPPSPPPERAARCSHEREDQLHHQRHQPSVDAPLPARAGRSDGQVVAAGTSRDRMLPGRGDKTIVRSSDQPATMSGQRGDVLEGQRAGELAEGSCGLLDHRAGELSRSTQPSSPSTRARW